jgi:hypothetical protein
MMMKRALVSLVALLIMAPCLSASTRRWSGETKNSTAQLSTEQQRFFDTEMPRLNQLASSMAPAAELKNLSVNKTALTGSADFTAQIEDRTDEKSVVLDASATVHVTFTAKPDNNNNQGDNSNSGGSLAITVLNAKGGLWFSSKWDGTRAVEQTFTDGNVSFK